ncbi:MAG: DUF3347 domain-containing protein [Candidatus Cyclobacteriaceae bacterium M2_1C_046]
MKNILIALVLILSVTACETNQTKEEESPEKEQEGLEKPETSQKSTDTTAEAQVISDEDLEAFRNLNENLADQILNSYLKIKDALVNTNGAEAKRIAASALKQIKNQDGEAMEMIRQDLAHMSVTTSVDHQREHFKTLSAHVYALVKATDANDQQLYKQYCPMAFDNTGAYWLSSAEEIRNPYFGDKMLKCGRVQETIEP